MAEKYFAFKYIEYIISMYFFIGLVVVIFVILLIASIIDFIERHKKGKKHGN